MKIKKVLDKLKKIVICIVCSITLVFGMPQKTEAGWIQDTVTGIVGSFLGLVLNIPDAVMALLNKFIAQDSLFYKLDYTYEGGGSASLYNFEVTPYDIFTSGLSETTELNVTTTDYDYDYGIEMTDGQEEIYNKLLLAYGIDLAYTSEIAINIDTDSDYVYVLLYDMRYDSTDDKEELLTNSSVKSGYFYVDGIVGSNNEIFNLDNAEYWTNEGTTDITVTALGFRDGQGYNLYTYTKDSSVQIIAGDPLNNSSASVFYRIDLKTDETATEETDSDEPIINTEITLPLLDANFFRTDEVETDKTDSAVILAPVISNVYKSVRNLCLVVMMLVLLYIGIRIILSTSSKDQSKYKTWLKDWLVGFCLLFCMQYIMSFVSNINTIIVEMLSQNEGDTYYFGLRELKGNGWMEYVVEGGDSIEEYLSTHALVSERGSFATSGNFDEETGVLSSIKSDIVVTYSQASQLSGSGDITSTNYVSTIDTVSLDANYTGKGSQDDSYQLAAIAKLNTVEYIRTLISHMNINNSHLVIYSNGSKDTNTYSIASDDDEDTTESSGEELEYDAATIMGYVALYICLVVEICMFLLIYIKRVFTLALYTMIAPFIALMYPIDKVGDGTAQGLNAWLKDYIFTTLTQPLHLLLYTIFIVSASQLINNNPVYACIMYGMMIVGEKYLKKIFGFEKAPSGGGSPLAGAAGGMLAMDGFRKLTGMGPKGPHGGGGSGSSEKVKRKRFDKSGAPAPTSFAREGSVSATSGETASSGTGSGVGSTASGATSGSSGNIPHSRGGTTPGSRGNAPGSRGNIPGARPRTGLTFGDRLRGLGTGIGGSAKRGLTRAITGGKYDKLKGKSKGQIAGAIAGNIGKWGGRVAGAGLGTALGVTVGAATAMATGNLNNLTAGTALGLTTGFTRGGQLGGMLGEGATGLVSNIGTDYQNYLADKDENYKNQLRIRDQLASFAEEDLSKEEKAIVEKYAPYVNFDGDMDKLETFMKLDEGFGGEDANIGDVILGDKLAKMYDLNTEEGRAEAERYLVSQGIVGGNMPAVTGMQNVVVSDAEVAQKHAEQEKAIIDAYVKQQQDEYESYGAQASQDAIDRWRAEAANNSNVQKDINAINDDKIRENLEKEKTKKEQERYDNDVQKAKQQAELEQHQQAMSYINPSSKVSKR